jgi:hypothetical protein
MPSAFSETYIEAVLYRIWMKPSAITDRLAKSASNSDCGRNMRAAKLASGRSLCNQAAEQRPSGSLMRLRNCVAAWGWFCRKFTPTALPISIHLISDWQAFRPADEDRRRAAWRSGEFDPCESAKQLLEENSHFKPRQMLTEASMDSLTKDCTT